MLKATSPVLLFEKKGKVDTSIETNNTIKVDFSHMSHVAPTLQPYTRCTCGAVVIDDCRDKQSIVMAKKKEENESSSISWVCSFCQKANSTPTLHIAPNNSKFILQQKIERELIPPILLFVVDQSGSMGESVSIDNGQADKNHDKKLLSIHSHLNDLIKKSMFYSKNAFKEEQMRKKYHYQLKKFEEKKRSGDRDQQSKNYYSKITFLMAMIEDYLKQISKDTHNEEFRMGFIFFNEGLSVMKPARQKTIPVFVHAGSQSKKDIPFQREDIDFTSFEDIFNAGRKFDRYFGDSRLKKLDMSKLRLQYIDTEGQTALGPALALAMGIASVHDIGSRIILVSDSQPNIGILSNPVSENNLEIYDKMQKILEERKMTIGVLSWIDDKINPNQQKVRHFKSEQANLKNQFQSFLLKHPSCIKEIELDFSIGFDQAASLNTMRKSLGNLLNRGYMGQALEIQVFVDNERVELAKFKHDGLDFRFIKFLNKQSRNWIHLQTQKVVSKDCLFPITTQIVVTYEDVYTKQKYLFVSYTKHKLIKTESPEEIVEYLGQRDTGILEELINLQAIKSFDREKVIPESYSSKISAMSSFVIDKIEEPMSKFSFKCESLNQLADIQNRMCDDSGDEEYL